MVATTSAVQSLWYFGTGLEHEASRFVFKRQAGNRSVCLETRWGVHVVTLSCVTRNTMNNCKEIECCKNRIAVSLLMQ